ncbi:metallophosphoesterase [Parapedobacter tibetensis]|uniref:metallophosphoesterase n=1 Tax=Parapedobacter tibetensis TaxID=2972951 RepID=UPI00214D9EA2|nr:metallophosphoesterase [Parapedobacter tibetensis]
MNIKVHMLALIPLLAGSIHVQAQQFTIPVFPDTQSEVGSMPEQFYSQIRWIADHKDSLHIPIVLHVGDVVNFDNHNHWEVASIGFDTLDQYRIPYAIALGNHDGEAVGRYSGSAAPGNVNQNLRKTAKFNAYFPTHRFITQRGRYEPGKSDNAYYTFKAGNTNWLVIALEFCPRMGAINWAGDIAARYDDYNVILLTHYHLNPRGEIVQNNAGYGDFSPQTVFDRLIKTHPNIRFVLSGHVMRSALKIDTREDGTNVYQLLQNYQNDDHGGGYLRLLHFDIGKGTVEATMYSPFYDKNDDGSRYALEGVEFLKMNTKN